MKRPPYKEIREHYEYLTPYLMDKKHPNIWTNPYCGIDWMQYFTPIEYDTWNVLRSFGQAPLYPQYPVGNYFLDFGNPNIKLGIECDGAAYHKDKEKDYKRDKWLFEEGWHIYRVTGKECFATCDKYNTIYEIEDEYEYVDILERFYATMEGVVTALAAFYFKFDFPDREYNKESTLAFRSLVSHISPAQRSVEEILSDKLLQKQIDRAEYIFKSENQFHDRRRLQNIYR